MFSVNQVELLKKVKRLLNKTRLPRFLHHFGPRTYEFAEHVLALLLREKCKASYRFVVELLRGFGMHCATYSTLAKVAKRVPRALWNALFNATVGWRVTDVAAIDGTYYSRSNPSFHYLARTGRKPPRSVVQATALLDTRRRKWAAPPVVRLARVHEARDAPALLRAAPRLVKLTADKLFDSEEFHRVLEQDYGVLPVVPVRKGVWRGVYRRKHAALFRARTYHRRVLIESAFSRNKRTQGHSVKNRLAKTIRTELTLRYINDNLGLLATLLDIFNRAGCLLAYN